MTKKDYMKALLNLCTEKQKDFFDRMYPRGPLPAQMIHAIAQVENTLKNLNYTKADVKEAETKFAEKENELASLLARAHRRISALERDLRDSQAEVARLENPISTAEENDGMVICDKVGLSCDPGCSHREKHKPFIIGGKACNETEEVCELRSDRPTCRCK